MLAIAWGKIEVSLLFDVLGGFSNIDPWGRNYYLFILRGQTMENCATILLSKPKLFSLDLDHHPQLYLIPITPLIMENRKA